MLTNAAALVLLRCEYPIKTVTAQFQPTSTSRAQWKGFVASFPISSRDMGASALNPLGHSLHAARPLGDGSSG